MYESIAGVVAVTPEIYKQRSSFKEQPLIWTLINVRLRQPNRRGSIEWLDVCY